MMHNNKRQSGHTGAGKLFQPFHPLNYWKKKKRKKKGRTRTSAQRFAHTKSLFPQLFFSNLDKESAVPESYLGLSVSLTHSINNLLKIIYYYYYYWERPRDVKIHHQPTKPQPSHAVRCVTGGFLFFFAAFCLDQAFYGILVEYYCTCTYIKKKLFV